MVSKIFWKITVKNNITKIKIWHTSISQLLLKHLNNLTESRLEYHTCNVYNAPLFEPCYEKTGFFAYAKTKTQISFAVTAKLISAFVSATRIVQSLYFLNPKFQASSHLLWFYSQVCVGPGRKPRRPVFSE